MSSYSEAEMEQGELSASPDLQDSPGVRLDEEEEEDHEEEEIDQEQEERSRRHEGEEDDDTLDIKPPQSHAGRAKDKRKHSKHRDERKRDRESNRDRNDDRGSTRSRDRSKDRYREESSSKESKSRPAKTPKDREMEDRRREKSRRERERLEKLERERYRLEREAARVHQDRLKAAEREKERERAERHRRKEEAASHDSRRRLQDDHRRERSRDKHGSREKSRSPLPKHSSRDKERSRRHDDDDRRKYRREQESPDRDVKIIEEELVEEPEAPQAHRKEEEDIHSPSAEDDQSAESSGSDSEGSRSERSDHHDQSEEGRSDVEPEAPRRPSTGKFRSKFDDDRSPEPEEAESDNDSPQNDDVEMEYMDQTPPQSPVELKPELPPYYPALQGCRNVEEFNCLNKIEEGTYGVVFRARDKKADEIVALKKLKMEKEKEGFPITSLREINTLLKAQHVNIVTVREIVVGSNIDKIYIVMDYVEHDLKSLMETMREPFMIGEVKTLMMQLLRGVNHLHDNWIIHRDLKTSNLLLSHKGILKIGDFGLAREYGSPLKQYTPIVVTLWYRAPELLLGCKEYSTAIDMWSVGCIFAELLTRKPLFPGKSELDELNRIFKDLGTPNERIWPGISELPGMKKCTFAEHPYNQLRNRFGSSLSSEGFDLMNRFLTYDPTRRISASAGYKHEYFESEPLPVPPSMFPTWPAKSEMPRRTHGNSPKPPSGGKAYSKLLGDDDIGFHLTGATRGAAAIGHGFSLKF